MYMTNRTTTRKQPLAFFFALFLLLAIAVAAPVNPARADNLSQGLELYQQKKFREATPYLEKAAQEGHEEAIAALDVIYAADAPAVPAGDKAAAKAQTGKTADIKERQKHRKRPNHRLKKPKGKPSSNGPPSLKTKRTPKTALSCARHSSSVPRYSFFSCGSSSISSSGN